MLNPQAGCQSCGARNALEEKLYSQTAFTSLPWTGYFTSLCLSFLVCKTGREDAVNGPHLAGLF